MYLKQIWLFGFFLFITNDCGGQNPTNSTNLTLQNEILFQDSFSGYADGLITNQYAFRNPGDPNAIRSNTWELTSGSLFAINGEAWTGVPDRIQSNTLSSNGNNSSVFRLITKRSDFRNVSVSFDLLNQGLSSTPTTPAVETDGVHIFLRYQSQELIYYASVNRRDDTIVIKKKVPGGISNDGTYYNLSRYVRYAVPYDRWQHVSASVRNNSNGSVSIEILIEGVKVLEAQDDGVAGPPIASPGKVGIRGDNADLKFKNFVVRSL